jgi:hypothetical protein
MKKQIPQLSTINVLGIALNNKKLKGKGAAGRLVTSTVVEATAARYWDGTSNSAGCRTLQPGSLRSPE